MTLKEAYKLYAATMPKPVPLGQLNQSYERHGEWQRVVGHQARGERPRIVDHHDRLRRGAIDIEQDQLVASRILQRQ